MFLMCLIYSQVPSLLGHSPLYVRGAIRTPLCCFFARYRHINDQQIVNFTSKSYRQDDQIIYSWHCGAVFSFVNGLRGCKSEDLLQIFYCHSCCFHHSCDIFPGCCHINRRHFVFSFSHQKKPSAHQDKRFMRKDIYHAWRYLNRCSLNART